MAIFCIRGYLFPCSFYPCSQEFYRNNLKQICYFITWWLRKMTNFVMQCIYCFSLCLFDYHTFWFSMCLRIIQIENSGSVTDHFPSKISKWVILKYETTHNHPQPPKKPPTTIHNHPQQPTTIHNHPQLPTTIRNYPKNQPQPSTTIHNHPKITQKSLCVYIL